MRYYLFIFLACLQLSLFASAPQEGFKLNFPQVSVKELIHFVSKVAQVNFIFNEDEVNFQTSVVSGKPVNPEELVTILVKILKNNNFYVKEENNYYLIEKKRSSQVSIDENKVIASADGRFSSHFLDKDYFSTYKLQYQVGSDVINTIKQLRVNNPQLREAIQSLQWMQSTNTLVFTGDHETIDELTALIQKLDVAKKQVFIEILVIETDVKNGLDFGLEWSAKGNYQDKFVAGIQNRSPYSSNHFSNEVALANKLKAVQGANIPLGKGFDLGIIGDLIFHKGKTFLTLGSLISALEEERSSTIVLNQKIITQDNEKSTIFVGDNIPFTGAVVETVGNSQQTTANIEYKDVGVNLSITPLLGEDDVITLEISEEISEALNHPMQTGNNVNGIQTTKTNMVTKVHVPDQHFLILSGMIRNAQSNHKTGIPCLGSLPLVGAAFSKTNTSKEKRNVIVFARPQIVQDSKGYNQITDRQKQLYKKQTPDVRFFEKGLDLVNQNP